MTPGPLHTPQGGSPDPTSYTTSELGRRITDLRDDIRSVRDLVSVLPDSNDLQNVGTAWQSALLAAERRIELVAESDRRYAEAERLALASRIGTMETWMTWGTRTILGIIIVALLGIIITGGAPW